MSPPDNRHRKETGIGPRLDVEFVDGDGCSGCLYKLALRYMLEHGTGTGRLILNADELAELGEPNLILMVLRLNDGEENNGEP